MSDRVDALVRRASTSDLHRVSDFDREIFGTYAYPYFILRQFHELLPTALLIAEAGGSLVGYILAGSGAKTSQGWILSLAVAPSYRRRGLGEQLVTEALSNMGETVSQTLLTVEPANTSAVRLYERLGFSTVDDFPSYFGEGERRFVMCRRS